MSKISIILVTAILGCFFFTMTAHSDDIDFDNGTGGTLTVSMSAADGPDFDFEPSNEVIISGGSSATAFVIGAHHTQVVNRGSGKQYAMASDNNSVLWRDISDSDDRQDPQTFDATTTNIGDIDANWNTM